MFLSGMMSLSTSAWNTTLSVLSSPKFMVFVPSGLLALNHTSPSTRKSPTTCMSSAAVTAPVNTVSPATDKS